MYFLRTHASLASLSKLQLIHLAAPPLTRSAATEQATKPNTLITVLAMGGKTNGPNDAGGESVGRVSHHAGFCRTFFNEKPAVEFDEETQVINGSRRSYCGEARRLRGRDHAAAQSIGAA